MINLIASGILGYLLGSVTLGIIVPRLMGTSQDIRNEGSGNVGATNVLRTQGRLQGGLVLLGDLLKGVIAAGFGLSIAGIEGCAIAGVGAMLGHCFPVYFNFRGGKGVATGAGVILVLMPKAMLFMVPVFLIVSVVSRMVSLGSLLGVLTAVICLAAFRSPLPVICFVIFATATIIWRHHGNIRRIIDGTENKFNWKKGKE